MAYSGKIDVDRGVMQCTHKASGMRISMYIDTPGVYFDDHLNPLPASLAKAAGFPTETLEKKRRMAQEMAKVKASLTAQLQIGSTQEVYKEAGRYRVLHFPETGMAVVESDGERLTPTPVALGVAIVLFDELVKEMGEGSAAEQVDASSTEATPTPPPAPTSPPGNSPLKAAPKKAA